MSTNRHHVLFTSLEWPAIDHIRLFNFHRVGADIPMSIREPSISRKKPYDEVAFAALAKVFIAFLDLSSDQRRRTVFLTRSLTYPEAKVLESPFDSSVFDLFHNPYAVI